jgi:rod shape-determining protein MreD
VKRVGLLALLALVLEGLRIAWLARFPIQPDFLLGIVVLSALAYRPPQGAVVGLVLGLLRDLEYGNPVGFWALPLAVIGWGVGTLGRSVYREALITQMVMLFGSSLALGSVEFLFDRGGELEGFFLYLARVVLPSALITALAVSIIYKAARDLYRDRHGWRRSTLRRLRSYERKILVKR